MAPFWSIPSGHGPYMRLSKPRFLSSRTVAVTAAAAAAATGGVACWQLAAKHLHKDNIPKDFKMPRPVMEATCGAIGEIAQTAVLYPLDTIKVRCQASGQSATIVVRTMFAQGLTASLFKQLYAGVVSTSLCSVAIGSLYYFSFCASKRMALDLPFLQPKPQQGDGTAAAAGAAAGVALAAARTQGEAAAASATEQPAAPSSSRAAAGGSQHAAGSQQLLGAVIASSVADMHGSAVLEISQQVDDELSADSRSTANVIAATSAATVGALIEAPVELFKHRTQAGQINGSMLGAMATALRTTGPGALYWGFFPFCLKSLPFDIGELWTYSTLRDVHDDLQKQQSPMGKLVQAVPVHVWDMAIGAAAGAAAVLISMPSDAIKTVMETNGVDMSKLGPVGSVKAFITQGKSMVAARGAGGLFIGVAPRLAEQVPSTCFYWLAVEACRRMLEPYTAP